MARTTPVKKATRSLVWLLVIAALLAIANGANAFFTANPKGPDISKVVAAATWTPKLALDLEGGTEIILQPQVASGQAAPTAEQLDQAVAIIRQRIDASGVSEAEINTQGSQNVVVSIPGIPDQATINRIESSAKLEFRPVLVTDAAASSAVGGSATPSPTPSDFTTLQATPSTKPTNGSDLAYVTPKLKAEFDAFSCADVDKTKANVADPKIPLITCDDSGAYKYILGPVEVAGETISDATNGQVQNSQGATTGQWAVNIVFNAKGTKEFAAVTTRLNAFPQTDARNRFAIVLDGRIISAPTTNAVITNGKPQISGNFTQATSKTLADQLKFGALPIGFKVQSNETITATLGKTQLQSGLLAGLIGLILVVLYSLLQYRSLASITIASLVVAAVLTYLVVVLLSGREGFRLSLAGVAGLIVAIGITADSFIVYFERIRDELRDGRALDGAVEAGWKRALRTIIASDAVNFLAAAILFAVAVGNVKGFALTLGITTLIDLVVVTLFTHPMLQLIARRPFFAEGHRFSGLDPKALGAVYRGRAQFREPAAAVAAKKTAASGEAQRRQTIAERKAAEAAASQPSTSRTKGKDS
ncbi:protein translocase subunit SecD [Lacisediminihabitans changchengi]|uniref:Protein translocase subunit SecD n=1 Tax=Lacisediminihabitans changchengi TaxID=2787634 RepID=A0A934SHK4_9MICO|nr:protein translocase subunit SecD [Lacisediminihabitans changchengi]MBK4346761.1 protein translocase subunit SecD [Lacisediminihabitans changchengi]MBK4348116.1 protein translocase subunit SecD [Lacisediminihabitans changchengi]